VQDGPVGIRYVTPAQRYVGHDHALLNRRHVLYQQAQQRKTMEPPNSELDACGSRRTQPRAECDDRGCFGPKPGKRARRRSASRNSSPTILTNVTAITPRISSPLWPVLSPSLVATSDRLRPSSSRLTACA